MNDNNLSVLFSEEEPEAGEIFLSGKINGQTANFLLDTGATFTSVVEADYIRTIPAQRTMHFNGIGGVKQNGDVIVIDKLELACKLFESQEIVRVSEGSNRKSTIGNDLLKEQTIYFDINKRKINFNASTPTDHPLQSFEIGKKGHIYLSSYVATHPKGFISIWDTGAGLTTIDSKVLEKFPENFVF